VLDAAYRLIQHNNPARLEQKLGINKRLIALHDESAVSFVPYASSVLEREGALESIEERLARREAPGSIAVLAANACAAAGTGQGYGAEGAAVCSIHGSEHF